MSLISLFNAGGRFMWASGSDYIGRRNTYTIFFVAQFVLFLLIPRLAAERQLVAVPGQPVHRVHDVRRRVRDDSGVPRRHLRTGERRRDSRRAAHGVERGRDCRAGDHHRAVEPREGGAAAGRAIACNIYDTPLQVLAGLLAVGFVLTLLVRPLRANARSAGARTPVTA